MKFAVGFFDRALLQRAANNKSEQAFNGECCSSGDIYASVLKGVKACKGLTEIKVGRASGGKFKGILKGIPVGGPYDIVFNIAGKSGKTLETAKVKSVMVGDLWLLAGQSNMQGSGKLLKSPKIMKEVRAYYMDNRWDIAKDPIHNMWNAAAPVHKGKQDGKNPHPELGAGPGIPFAQEMYRIAKVPQGLIACAHGGSALFQWDPALKDKGDDSFYGAAINRLNRLGGKISGVLWYQGCADAHEYGVAHYDEGMKNLINAFRKDSKNPALPFIMAQIGSYCAPRASDRFWSEIRFKQLALSKKFKNVLTVPVIDLDLDDPIHLSGESHKILGVRFADAMMSLKNKAYKNPIEFDSISFSKDIMDYVIVKLSFKNVYGSLKSACKPSGFIMIANDDYNNCLNGGDWLNLAKNFDVGLQTWLPCGTEMIQRPGRLDMTAYSPPCKIELKGSDVYLHTSMLEEELGRYSICYGYGKSPYCNITDERNRSIPVFRAETKLSITVLSEFFKEIAVSTPFYMQETESNMGYPPNIESIKFVKVYCPAGESLYHPEKDKLANAEEKIFYYRMLLNFQKDENIELRFAYDGPVKIFFDKEEVYKDMQGTNPMGVDKFCKKYKFSAGVHEVLIVEASNKGRACGIKCRAALPKGKKYINLPALIPIENK